MLVSRRFLPLFITQLIGAFCDNVFKNAFVLLSTFGLARENGWNPGQTVFLIGGLFILPFVVVSGWAGYVSDIWPRHTFVRALKTFEAPCSTRTASTGCGPSSSALASYPPCSDRSSTGCFRST